jgi:hypothetical protein
MGRPRASPGNADIHWPIPVLFQASVPHSCKIILDELEMQQDPGDVGQVNRGGSVWAYKTGARQPAKERDLRQIARASQLYWKRKPHGFTDEPDNPQ